MSRSKRRHYNLSEKPNLKVSSTTKEPFKVLNGKESYVAGITGNSGRAWHGMNTGEYVSALDGAKGRVIFEEMRRSDPKVGSVLKAISLPIRAGNWYIEPASAGAIDVLIAQIVEANLLHGMALTWDDTIRQILLMLPFGFSIMEKIWEVRPDGLIGIRKLAPRLPTSIVDWKFDRTTSELIGPEQQDTDGARYVLPMDKLLIFTNDKEGDNWEGISILRSAYKPWFIKSQLEKIDAIKHDRHGVGIPTAMAPQGTKTGDASWRDVQTTLENIQAQEQSFLIKPYGWEIDILGAGGDKAGTNVIDSIKYHDEAIGKAMLAQFIDLGTSESGSRALGSSFIDLFKQSIQTYADYICEVINRFCIREMVNYNWSVKQYPRLRVNKITQPDPTVLSSLVGAKLLTPDASLEAVLRNMYELPEQIIEELKEEKPKAKPEEKTPDDIIEQDEKPDEKPIKEAQDNKETKDKKDVDLATKKVMPFEVSLIDPMSITLQLDNATKSATRTILALRDEQRNSVLDQVLSAKRVPQIVVPKKREMYEALMLIFNKQYDVGMEQVRREIKKQTGKAFADVVKKKRQRVDADEMFDLVEEEMMLNVESAANKLSTQIISSAIIGRRVGLQDAELRKEVTKKTTELSDSTWTSMAEGAVNGGWGAGRTEGVKEFKDEIDYVYRSAILDSNTCAQCSAHDGDRWLPGEEEIMPDKECFGGNRCRCVNIYVMKSESGKD